jgi:hypothetical protein
MTLRDPFENMSQHDAVRFLSDQGLPANVIHEHLVEVFGDKALAYSTVTRTLRETSWTISELPKGRPPNFSIDASIVGLLDRDPTRSLREIAEELRLSVSTIFYVLTTRMGYCHRKCRLVPHALSPQQKEDRLTKSRALLAVLQTAKKLKWRFILTGDESWFFYVNDHQELWLPPDSEAPEVSLRLISTPKVIITLFWNTSGLHVSDFLVGESFNAQYFVRNILHRIHLLPIVSIAHTQKKTIPLAYGQCSYTPFKSDNSEIVSDASGFGSASSVFTRSSSIQLFSLRIFERENAWP